MCESLHRHRQARGEEVRKRDEIYNLLKFICLEHKVIHKRKIHFLCLQFMLNAIADRISVTKADSLFQDDLITSFFNGNVTISKQQC